MTPHPEPVFWALVALPALALLATSALRWVPAGQWLVTSHRGVVRRVSGPGLALRLPLLEHGELVASGPQDLTVVVRATTRDGSEVRLLAEARVLAHAPAPGAPYVDPRDAGERALEEVLGAALGRHAVDELPGGLVTQVTHLGDEADRTTRPLGLEVVAVEVAELDVLLTPGPACRGPG